MASLYDSSTQTSDFLQIKNCNLSKDLLSIGFNYVIITTSLTKNMGWLATAKSQTGVA